MKTHLTLLVSLIVWASAATAWPQDSPPPPPVPSGSPRRRRPRRTFRRRLRIRRNPRRLRTHPPGSYPPPPSSYAPPPGAVLVAPGQPYPYAYPPPGPYARPLMLVPAPPMQNYNWNVSLDALFLERSSGGSVFLGSIMPNAPYPNVPTGNMYSDDQTFSLAPGMRLEVSRKFDNDITLSGTYWGLQQWSASETFNADPIGETALGSSPYLNVPIFDTSLGYTYTSAIDNVEFNARFRFNPSDSYWQLDWLLGTRYIYFADHLTLTGVDTYNSGATETVDYQTTNNLLGVQTGLLFVHGWERFQWEAGLKCGLMANMYHQQGSDTVSQPAPLGFVPSPNVSNNGTDVAGVFEFSIAARHPPDRCPHPPPGISNLRHHLAGPGPAQLSGLDHGGNVAFDGLSVGVQATW